MTELEKTVGGPLKEEVTTLRDMASVMWWGMDEEHHVDDFEKIHTFPELMDSPPKGLPNSKAWMINDA